MLAKSSNEKAVLAKLLLENRWNVLEILLKTMLNIFFIYNGLLKDIHARFYLQMNINNEDRALREKEDFI